MAYKKLLTILILNISWLKTKKVNIKIKSLKKDII